jgi:lipopolysaccharide transport system ATP-binding protein
MKQVSQGEGRTVMFVSHSMTSIQALCTSALFLNNGCAEGVSTVNETVENYLYGNVVKENTGEYLADEKNIVSDFRNQASITKVQILDGFEHTTGYFKTSESIRVRIYWTNKTGVSCSPNFQLKVSGSGVTALIATDSPIDWTGEKKKAKGDYISDFIIPANWLNGNDYFLSVALDSHSPRLCYENHADILKLTIHDKMDEHSLARGMFTSVREDAVLWAALECSFKKIS